MKYAFDRAIIIPYTNDGYIYYPEGTEEFFRTQDTQEYIDAFQEKFSDYGRFVFTLAGYLNGHPILKSCMQRDKDEFLVEGVKWIDTKPAPISKIAGMWGYYLTDTCKLNMNFIFHMYVEDKKQIEIIVGEPEVVVGGWYLNADTGIPVIVKSVDDKQVNCKFIDAYREDDITDIQFSLINFVTWFKKCP